MKTPRIPPTELQGAGEREQDKRGLEEILQRAREDDAGQPDKERRHVFQRTKASFLETPVLRLNKKATSRAFSTFNIILVIFGLGVGIVLYISNIITVNHLAAELGFLQREYGDIMNAQTILLAEVNQRSSWERIERIATDRLGLQFPQTQGRWITLDEEMLERVDARQSTKP